MKNKYVRFVACVCLIAISFCAVTSLWGCAPSGESGEYTYRSYTSALGTNWNPHSWETSADREVLELVTSPLVSVLPLNTEEGTYQWSFDMARSVEDVTSECRGDIIKYNVDIPDGMTAVDIDEGYVFEITLREGLKFEDGTPIDSSSFVRSMRLLLDPEMKNSRANLYLTGEAAIAGGREYFYGDGADDFSGVGCYAVSPTAFRYVTDAYIDYNYFLSSLSSSWLVHEGKYLEGLDRAGELVSTNYNTSKSSTVSTGPYRISSHQGEKELVLVRNEMWYGWQIGEDGEKFSYTEAPVDGQRVRQYETTKIVISVMDDATAKQAFMRGELSVWQPSADEYSIYRFSDNLYREDETYTMSLFFNTDTDALRQMDRARGNENSVVLSNHNFRRAFSLAIDRAEFCTATEGYRPEYALLNDLYYYDIYNDPESVYRASEEAKAAICRLYDTAWGEGTPYPTLDAAYASITGYNLTEAHQAFATACSELSKAGIYTPGEPVRIRVAWAKGAISSDDNKQVALINRYLNAAARGSGFGKITLEPIGQIASRYAAVPNGEYAIGYGAWGGAAFYPFRALLVYMDPDYESLHEGACWDPSEEMLTLDINGDKVTMSWQAWARSMTGSGSYATADALTKLYITSRLEEGFLKRYYRIPLAASSSSVMLSYQLGYYTSDYNVMYGFGGLRLLKYYYDDLEWSEYVRSEGGRLRYE